MTQVCLFRLSATIDCLDWNVCSFKRFKKFENGEIYWFTSESDFIFEVWNFNEIKKHQFNYNNKLWSFLKMISYRKVASKIFDWFQIDRFQNEEFFEVINLAKSSIMRCDQFLKWSISKWFLCDVTHFRIDRFRKDLFFEVTFFAKWPFFELTDVEMTDFFMWS